MSVATTFQPIHQPRMFSTPKNSRPNSSMSCATTASTTDSSENESSSQSFHSKQNKMPRSWKSEESGENTRDSSSSPPSMAEKAAADNKRILLRRSSSAMRVRELRDVLTKMTEETESGNDEGEEEVAVTGSQKARLLVASQQCLVSRLQDLRHEMESMDNEVSRVRNDIVNSRKYFSAMMGIPCGPEWTTTTSNSNTRQQTTDSAYTSPTSFISRSTDISPYSSDNDYPHTAAAATSAASASHSSSSSSSSTSYDHHHHHYNRHGHHRQHQHHPSPSNTKANNAAFRELQQFKDQQQQQQQQQQFSRLSRINGGGQHQGQGHLSRSDSCSSFASWRSETEMASLFPDDHTNNSYNNRSASVSPQVTPRTVRQRVSPSGNNE